ncbi:ATP-binding protein [Staphylococcus canis]|uniref:Sensor protein SrrB n=1 Tax=Staphylococcus canis TaxID=2724942 RepID=A0ABS0T9C3_9STAP|nr:ATP-binding protein [Staphylococcus canis]MBI5975341.1 cell wall metabolism sensor histidine kinase WalK [Staphylococcus canis]
MKRLNTVVVKLWLTIILIVTTVLILLSAALITFMQYYITQTTEQSLYENAENITKVLEQSSNRDVAIKNSEILLESHKGLIILPDKKKSISQNTLKSKMLQEIEQHKAYQKVFKQDKPVLKHVTIEFEKQKRTYVLLGYPSKDVNGKPAAVFIYQDLKSIDETNNYIAIIILITAIIFLAITTIFAFFLSTRITKPLRLLKNQAKEVLQGHDVKRVPIYTKDEIGELAMTFNKMSRNIQSHINALTTSKNVRDTLINSMVEGVLGINHKREIILSNEMAHNMLTKMSDSDRTTFETQITQTFHNQSTEYQEYEINKSYFVVIMTYIDKIEHNGSSGLVVVIRDMTNEHHMEQVKKDFIANVSHELRTPIALLQGYTESIVDGIVTEPEEINESLLVVLDESKRLNRLVNELLNVAKMDAEGIHINKENQPMTPLIQKMAAKYRKQALEYQLSLNFEEDRLMNELWSYDFDKIEQVLTNLVDNATRYTQSGDSISITSREEGNYYVLEVQDTGVGIAPEHLESVFERFYKVDAARKRGKQGTGLGLFISRMIVEAHGGQLQLESTVNVGTTFIIKLPKP